MQRLCLFAEELPVPRDLRRATQRARIEQREDTKRQVARQHASEVLALARHVVVEPVENIDELVLARVTKQELKEPSTLRVAP